MGPPWKVRLVNDFVDSDGLDSIPAFQVVVNLLIRSSKPRQMLILKRVSSWWARQRKSCARDRMTLTLGSLLSLVAGCAICLLSKAVARDDCIAFSQHKARLGDRQPLLLRKVHVVVTFSPEAAGSIHYVSPLLL